METVAARAGSKEEALRLAGSGMSLEALGWRVERPPLALTAHRGVVCVASLLVWLRISSSPFAQGAKLA